MAGVKGRSGGARPNTGGARPNSGPKPKNVSVVAKSDPVDFLIGVMNDPKADGSLRVRAAGLAAQYTWPLTDGLDGLARLDANYVGTSYSEFRPTNAFRQKVSSYTLANVRVGVEAKDWGAYVYVNNITDELAYVTKNQSAISAGTINGVTVRPRTVGVTFNKKF